MSQIRAIKIGEAQYNVVQASAVQQKKLMLMLSGKIAMNSATGGVEEIDTKMLFGALMTLPESTFDEVASIVLHKTVLAGKSEIVTIDNFQGSISLYFKLVAEAVKFNLGDFFTWLDSENAAARAKKQAK